MQWLIDIVLEALGIPPCYIDRGDPASPDFTHLTLNDDGLWHELDLSSIVPEGAQAVTINVFLTAAEVGRSLIFRQHGNSEPYNTAGTITNVANLGINNHVTVSLSSDRKLDYALSAATWAIVSATVCGWIL